MYMKVLFTVKHIYGFQVLLLLLLMPGPSALAL